MEDLKCLIPVFAFLLSILIYSLVNYIICTKNEINKLKRRISKIEGYLEGKENIKFWGDL